MELSTVLLSHSFPFSHVSQAPIWVDNHLFAAINKSNFPDAVVHLMPGGMKWNFESNCILYVYLVYVLEAYPLVAETASVV
jgi:hypothetical protein